MDDHQFNRLLAHFGFSREGYHRVRKGVKKRLRRHMQALGCQDLTCYLAAIEALPRERSECLRRLSVPISRIMRDGAFWETLSARILPDLVDRFGNPLQVLSAGCACGEEVYSLAISARSTPLASGTHQCMLHILATDRNPACLARAQEGIYPRSSFRELDPERRTRHFIPLRGGRRYRIRPELQAHITWLCCEIDRLPLRAAFHLLLLRNSILTYLKRSGQSAVLAPIIGHLRPGGVLVVGHRERLPAAVPGLVPRFGLPYVYVRTSG